MPIPQPDASQMFDHSAYQDKWDSHGRGQVPDRHGAFHRPIARVLCVPAPTGPGSRCGSTRSLGWGLTANRPAHRAIRKSAGFDALRIDVIGLRLPDKACAPVRLRNSDKCFSFLSSNFRKTYIRTNRCKLRYLAEVRFHIARTWFAFPAPWCQYSNGGYPFKNYRRNRDAQNEFNHYACVARRNLPNRGKS